jgi:hypothetical protein
MSTKEVVETKRKDIIPFKTKEQRQKKEKKWVCDF